MREVTRCVIALGVAALLSAAASAEIYMTGFEAPIIPASIVGQDGWLAGSTSGNSQSVVNTFSHSGSQSLGWDNSGTFNSFYSVRHPFNGQAGAITAATPLEIACWLFVDSSSTTNRLYGVYAVNLGTGTLGSTSLGMTLSGSGAIRAGTSWSSTYSAAPLATIPSLVNTWIKVVFTYDGVGGGLAVYDSSQSLAYSTTFAAVSLANANGNGTTWNVNLGTDYVTTTDRAGKGYHDDLSIRVVPEPASLLALGLCAMIAVRRR